MDRRLDLGIRNTALTPYTPMLRVFSQLDRITMPVPPVDIPLVAEEDGTYHFLLLKYPTQQTWPAQTVDLHTIGSFLLNTPVRGVLTNCKQRRRLQGWLFSALVYQAIKLHCREI